jgi:hypothetical protein
MAINSKRGSDRSSGAGDQTNRKASKIMFTILNNNTPIIYCEDLQTAISTIKTLEAGLDRLKQHSPYTIIRAAK